VSLDIHSHTNTHTHMDIYTHANMDDSWPQEKRYCGLMASEKQHAPISKDSVEHKDRFLSF